MASRPQLSPSSKVVATLRYFDKYDYPLTKQELIYWQSTAAESSSKYQTKDNLFFLPGRQKIVTMRQQRVKISAQKWQIAKEVGERLRKFIFIQAIFVTGSLAMNNAKKNDDIDLMVVTAANTLWVTRFFVNIYLSSVRRYPNQKNVTNVVCTNLWLDENNLSITPHNLYTAHEIIQAKVLWDRNHTAQKFLSANSWIKNYLPNARPSQNTEYRIQKNDNWLLYILNSIFYILQLVYMKPKMTTERVNPGSAFFHPKTW